MADSSTSASSSAVARYITAAGGSSGFALASILDRALRDRSVYTYGELLDLASVQALTGGDHKAKVAQLELFAYGTYADYKAMVAAGSISTLDEVLLEKLKMLTIASIAASRKVVPYADLQAALDIPDAERLESLVRNSIYANLITAKLDQRAQLVEIYSALGRDVRPDQVDALLDRVTEWRSAVDTALSHTLSQIEMLNKAKADEHADNATFEAEFARMKKDASAEVARSRSTGAEGMGLGMGMGAAMGDLTRSAMTMLGGFMGRAGAPDEDFGGRRRGPGGQQGRRTGRG